MEENMVMENNVNEIGTDDVQVYDLAPTGNESGSNAAYLVLAGLIAAAGAGIGIGVKRLVDGREAKKLDKAKKILKDAGYDLIEAEPAIEFEEVPVNTTSEVNEEQKENKK